MTLKTWSNFSKKINSTLQPTGQSRDYTVYLKENTSIEKPVFILGTGIDAGINYCQCFGNYYFVDDIVMISADQVEVHCTLDVLATHKTAIGAYSAFIERSASAHDQFIIDQAISARQVIVDSAITTNELWPIDQIGCFIVRTVGDAGDATGISSWVLTASELGTLLGNLFDENNPDYAQVISDDIVKSFFNPFQYIVSVMWFPINKSNIEKSSSENMQLGFFAMGSYKKIKAGFYFDSVDITKPTNYYTNDFRAYHPNFTQLNMHIPGVGVVSLDPVILSHYKLTAYTCIDYTTGNINVRLQHRDASDNIIGDIVSYSGQVGVPIPVGQINGVSQGITNLANPIASVVAGAGAATLEGILQGVGNGFSGAANALTPSTSILGNPGNMAQMIANPRLITSIINYGTGDIPNTVYGRPFCKNRVISTLSGFIKCQGASVPLAAPDTETQAVNNYLNTGFYYE